MINSGSMKSMQVLRGIAALLVVLYHVRLSEPRYGAGLAFLPDLLLYGNAGVDLFFVVSGFMMTAIAGNRYGSMQAAGHFLARRAWRVIPPYWFYTTLVLVLMLVAPGLANRSAPGQSVLASYLLLPQAQLPLLLVGWTLVHEAYFYLMLAAVIALVQARYVPAYLAAWALATLLGHALLPAAAAPWQLLVTNPLTLEFIAGALIGHYWRRLPGRLGLPVFALGAATLGAILIFMGQFEQPGPFARIVLFGGPSALMVLGAVRWEEHATVAFPRWLVGVGDSSYSLYLSHIFVLVAVARTWTWSGVNASPWSHVAFAVVTVTACVLFGRLSFRLLEHPLLNLGRRFRRLPPTATPSITSL